MEKIRFAFDERKALQNEKKHGVSFEEAKSVFFREETWLAPDFEHSQYEERDILWGMSSEGRWIMVCHTYSEDDEIIRIISARELKQNEAVKGGDAFPCAGSSHFWKKLTGLENFPIDIDEDVAVYFLHVAQDLDMPWRKLVNGYLRECVRLKKRLNWSS